MMNKKLLAMAGGLSLFAALAFNAEAASVRITCETRGTSRSKISVDGRDLVAGVYTAQVISGVNTANSANSLSPVGGEVEFDFDSNPRDIARGATAISPTFIQGNMVTGQIFTADGFVVASATVACRAR